MPGISVSPDAIEGVLLIPADPQLRTLSFEDDGISITSNRQRLVFPYTLYMIFHHSVQVRKKKQHGLSQLRVAFSQTPFTGDLTDKIYGMPVLNTMSDFSICFYEWPTAPTTTELAKTVINQFWNSPFRDYGDHFSYWHEVYSQQFITAWKKATAEKKYKFVFNKPLKVSPSYGTIGAIAKAYPKAFENAVIFKG